MVVARKIVVTVTTCSDPAYLIIVLCNRKHACIDCLAVYCLLLMPCDAVHVAQSHELLDWPVHEDEVTLAVSM